MPPRITEIQRKGVLELPAQGFDRETIAARVGVTLGQVSAFASLQRKLYTYAENPRHAQRRVASSVASHISTLFVFNTFQDNGLSLDWQELLDSGGHVFVIQVKALNAR
jgi:hypothetical protein